MGHVPWSIRKRLQYYIRLNVPAHNRLIKKRIKFIKHKGSANVMFICSTLAMWRYQEIMELMMADKHYKIALVVCTINEYSDDERRNHRKKMLEFFKSKGIEPIDADSIDINIESFMHSFSPDLNFYAQPYSGIYNNCLEWEQNMDRLFVYCPYGISTENNRYFIDCDFRNYAWLIPTATSMHEKICKREMRNNGENVIALGEAHCDSIMHNNTAASKIWKPQNHNCKKLIWAPHFSITPNMCFLRSGFIEFYDVMLWIAEKYYDTLQIAFKPHPRLRTQLYSMSEWGKKRTDDYYQKWASMPNTQLEEGSYEALFATSDAMLHDSSSFTGEYLYTCKPVAFASSAFERVRNEANDFGKACMDLHYNIGNKSDLIDFIENVIIAGKDPKANARKEFFNTVLKFNDDKTVGQRIYETISDKLGFSSLR